MLSIPKPLRCGGACLIMLSIVLSAAGATDGPPDAQSSAAKDQDSAQPAKVITLRIGKEFWRFAPAADGIGINVAVETQGEQTIEMKLGIDPPIGEVVDLVAAGQELEMAGAFIVLGVAAMQPHGKEIRYFMFTGGTNGLPHNPQAWYNSGSLITRPGNRPFEMMAVGQPGGDSVMLSLQDLTRQPGDTDSVEHHLFVNHCPIPGFPKTALYHHEITDTYKVKYLPAEQVQKGSLNP